MICQEASSPNRTLDLASALEIGPNGNKASSDLAANGGCVRSVMTIAFEFAFESHMQDHVASMARQYVRSIISSVQRVALALSPSNLGSHAGLRSPLGTPEAQTLARWICNSYRWMTLSLSLYNDPKSLHVVSWVLFRCYLGVEMLKSGGEGNEPLLKSLWHHSDAVMCCSLKVCNIFLWILFAPTNIALLQKGDITNGGCFAGTPSIYLCKPGRAWHAWNHAGCASRHIVGEDLRWPWP